MDGSVIVSRERRQAQQWRVTTRPDMSRVGLWRTGFTVEEQREFFTVAGTLLEGLATQLRANSATIALDADAVIGLSAAARAWSISDISLSQHLTPASI
jgi:hypothetical protein